MIITGYLACIHWVSYEYLHQAAAGPVPDVQVGAVPPGGQVGRVKAPLEGGRCAPFGRDEHVIVRLVPEVVPERYRLIRRRPHAWR